MRHFQEHDSRGRALRPGRARHCAVALLLAGATLVNLAHSGEPVAAPKAPPVKDADLERSVRKPMAVFPWMQIPQPKPPPKDNGPEKTGDSGMMDMTSGDLILRSWGEFAREVKKVTSAGGASEDKEVLKLTKDVELEQVQAQFVLRGQTINVIRDLKTGAAEQVQAHGKVEVWTPERSGRGESLVYETRFGPHGEVLKNMYTIEADRAHNGRATLWQGNDVIEAEKFISDRRLDTFRVQGGPVALVTLPGDPAAPAKPSAGGMLPGMSMIGGGKVRLQADGEIYYEGATGKIRITRNVVMYQDSGGQVTRLSADEVVISLLLPPPGLPQTAGNSMFSGSLKSLECSGRVEVKTPGYVLLFDKGNLDRQRNVFLMEMKNAKDEVRIYSQETAGGGNVFIVPKSLAINMDTGELNAGGPMRREGFEGSPPSNRPAAPK